MNDGRSYLIWSSSSSSSSSSIISNILSLASLIMSSSNNTPKLVVIENIIKIILPYSQEMDNRWTTYLFGVAINRMTYHSVPNCLVYWMNPPCIWPSTHHCLSTFPQLISAYQKRIAAPEKYNNWLAKWTVNLLQQNDEFRNAQYSWANSNLMHRRFINFWQRNRWIDCRIQLLQIFQRQN